MSDSSINFDHETMTSAHVFADTVATLGGLRPEYPKFFSMADLKQQSRRRWVRMGAMTRTYKLENMRRLAMIDCDDRTYATFQVADCFSHAIFGRVVASFASTGRVWDTGTENMSVRTDIEGSLDWAGVLDTTMRMLPGDEFAGAVNTVEFPSEEAIAQWIAHRSARTITPIFDALVHDTNIDCDALWASVGECILGVSAMVPAFMGSGEEQSHRRGQLVMGALNSSGLAVRGKSSLRRPTRHQR